MKKLLLCILVVFMLGSFTACGEQTNESIISSHNVSFESETTVNDDVANESMVSELKDNTVQFNNSFVIEGKTIIQDMAAAADFAVIYPDLESVYNGATNVVVGEVTNIQYTDDEAIPRTIYSFAVAETLKGDIEENSLISISESNGYVRMSTFIETYGTAHFEDITDEEISNGIILQSLGGAPLPEVGEQYIVFLGEQKQEGRICGAYAVMGNFMGRYVLDQDTNLYSRFCPNEDPELYTIYDSVTRAIVKEEPMSLSEIKEEISSFAEWDAECAIDIFKAIKEVQL